MESKRLIPTSQQTGERLDAYLANALDLSRSAVQGHIEAGCVTVNGQPARKNYRLAGLEDIVVTIPEAPPCEAVAQAIPLDIVYEDDDLLVVNKPKGMVVHPAAGHADGTLVNALLAHCGDSLSGINGVMRPGIVHRIDKDTSGLLIVAKNDRAHIGLAEQIRVHSFTRVYEAVVVGHPTPASGTVAAPIGRHPVERKRMAVVSHGGKEAITHYETLADYTGYAHMRLRLETGRTHQIRVHMAYIGHPVAGDTVYGNRRAWPELAGQCLHAREIGFVHPITGAYLHFQSPLPDYFTAFLARIRDK